VVVANILAGTLIELAPRIVAAVRPGGRLALSGLLADQVQAVAAAYGSAGRSDAPVAIHPEPGRSNAPVAIVFAAPILRDGWTLLHGTRESS
jgi:hypothetical protein